MKPQVKTYPCRVGRKRILGVTAALLVGAASFASSAFAADASADAYKAPDVAPIVAQAAYDPAAHELLPPAMRKSGVLVVGMDATKGIPWAYLGRDGQIQGLTRDVADSLAKVLGVKADIKNTPFENLVPGLQADRFQLTIAPMLQTPKRLKILDMIGWIHGGSSFMVRKSSTLADLSMSDAICGMVLGGVSGTSEAHLMEVQAKKCAADGKKPIQLHLFPKSTDNILALKAGRVEAISTSTAQIGYIASVDPSLKRSGEPFNSGLSSMALAKDSPLAPAIVAAFKSLIASGVYGKLLSAYGLDILAMKHSVLNEMAKH